MVNTKNDEDINDNHKEISKDVDHIIEDDSDIAQTAMGDVGIWQIWLCVYLSLIKFPTVWAQFGIVFLAPQTDFHCVDKGREQKDQCVTNTGEKCTNWTYNHKIFTETITSEWDLVCEKNEYVNAGQAITLIGFIIGNVVCSMIADRIGRKKPLIISGIVQFAVGIIAAFSTSYTMFTFLRFIQAVAVGGSITVGFVLMMEVLGGKWRSIMITLTSIPFTVAHFAMVFIAYMTRHWRLFQLGTSLPCAFYLLYIWVIPESPRWLLAVGRDDEAMKILDAAAIKNKNPSPQSFAMTPRNTKIKQDREYTPGIADFYNSNTLLINTLYLCFNWFATGVSFFGLEQFVSLLDGDIFVHIAITASGLIPGMFLSVWLSERLGRQPTLIIGQLLCGCSCLTLVFILNDGGQVSGLCVAMITLGVLGSGILFPTIYLYSGEYYPILIRNLGVGICCGFSRFGFMVAPFINDLKRFHNNIPPLLMGLICIIASVMSYFLPETKECDSPDIILFQQAQRLRKVSVTPGIITVNRGDIAAELEGKYKSLSR